MTSSCILFDLFLSQVEFFISRLLKYLEDILAAGSMGCVVRLAELINKYDKVEYQKKYITALSDALHIPEDTNEKPFCKLVLCMKTYELLYKTSAAKNPGDVKQPDEENKQSDMDIRGTGNEVCTQVITKDDVNYHGCCILKNLFSFKKCKIAVESFLELSVEEFKTIACHSSGSFSIESFFNSEWIPLKSKINIGERCLSCTHDMACDKWGSRVVDCVYKGVDDAMQERLKYVLREHKSRLESDMYGRIVLYNCGVKQHVDTMRQIQEQQQQKRKKLFENILAGESDGTKEGTLVVPKKKVGKRFILY